MDSIQSLHYAIGEIAYAIANADGKIQKEEQKKFQDMVAAELRCRDYDFDIADIIFQIMQKDHTPTEDAYNYSIKQIRLNSHYLSPELKKTFIKVIDKIAHAYPPVTREEQELIERFQKDIEPLEGDPVYYK